MEELFDSLDLADLQQEGDRLSGQGGFGNYVMMPEKEGYVTVRFLPPAKGKKFFVATRTHRLVNGVFHCPCVLADKRWQDADPLKPCPVCKYVRELYKKADKADEQGKQSYLNVTRQIKAIDKYYYNVIVRRQMNRQGVVEENIGPKILAIGKGLHERVIRAVLGDPKSGDAPLGDISNLRTGRDFKIVKRLRKSGNEEFPNYDDSKFLDPTPLGTPEQVEAWVKAMHDLTAERKLVPLDQLNLELQRHLGMVKDEAEAFDPAEAARSVEQQVEAAVRGDTPAVEDQAMDPAAFFAELQAARKSS